jgi:hypothetical protein
MSLTRRKALLFGAAAGAAGLGGAVLRGAGRGGVAAHALEVIERVYGPDFAAHEAAIEFAAVYEGFVLDKGLSGRLLNAWYRLGLKSAPILGNRLAEIDLSIIEKFATSTNVILASETGVPLEFIGLFQPYLSACANQLAAQAIS